MIFFQSGISGDEPPTVLISRKPLTAALAIALFTIAGCGKATTPTMESVDVASTTPEQTPLNQVDIDHTANSAIPDDSGQHVELGRIRWGRDLQLAKNQSATSSKPILVLFQEVPG